MNPFFNRDVISIKDFSRSDFDYLFSSADKIERMSREERANLASGRVLAVLFFEPSTRTRLSFEVAMLSIGGHSIGFPEPKISSVEKGENLADTLRVVESYADALVLRHGMEGAARFAAEVATKPVINAGSGTEEHPTQAMLDIYTMLKEKGKVDGLNIALVGDLRYGRTVYSLLYGLSRYNTRVFLVSPPQLRVRSEALIDLEDRMKISEHKSLDEVIDQLDVLYATRIQKERFPDPHEYEKVRGSYVIDRAIVEEGKEDLIIMHPLPRVDEIKADVDDMRQARYFKQTYYGMIIRSALIALILKQDL